MLRPMHTLEGPDIADGNVFTVITAVVLHPVGSVYVIVVVPGATPVTIPVAEPTVAIAGLLLTHVPPPASVSVIVAAGHTCSVPLIAVGNGFTVTVIVALQLIPVDTA